MDLKTIINILCDPYTKDSLEIVEIEHNTSLFNLKMDRFYPVRDSIPVFIKDEMLGLNEKYKDMYNRIAFLYDTYIKIMGFLFHKGWRASRGELVKNINNIKPGSKILEVSIGTGFNLLFLPRNAFYYGIDISWNMLKRCKKRAKRIKHDVWLALAEAEWLPFKDESFDVVYHIGGINFFNDKKKAIDEMIRVAKSGTKIVIVDETESHSKNIYKKTPLIKNYFKETRNEEFYIPLSFIPSTMLDIQIEYLWNNRFFCLSFIKP